MDKFFDRLAIRAATIDELLSDHFEHLPGQKTDADLAARRLSAWCRSSAGGDWVLFSQRLARDGLTIADVMPRLATVRRKPDAPIPSWVTDSRWIEAGLGTPANEQTMEWLRRAGQPQAFEDLLAPVVELAQRRVWLAAPQGARANIAETAVASLCHALLRRLSELCAPALYYCFVSSTAEGEERRHSAPSPEPDVDPSRPRYDRFVNEMRKIGFRRLFETKPILLRLIASVTRQWIETTSEFVARLYVDLPSIRERILGGSEESLVTDVEGGISDLHNFGRSVQLAHFDGGSRVLYKPKDLRLDARWASLVARLNASDGPVDLRVPRVLPRNGYGWSEFIDHTECSDRRGFERFFRRAGAWLCLFHVFAATDMHEENMIAAGDHPVPVDLEVVLQALEPGDVTAIPEMRAAELAGRRIFESVTMTGLLPTYGRSQENTVVGSGGLNNVQTEETERYWENINTDSMKPVRRVRTDGELENIPKFRGQQARLGDFVDTLISGFEAYASFLLRLKATSAAQGLFDGFAGLPTRRLIRNTRFYSLLLERLKDYRNMEDGAEWSAHLDFVARLADWERLDDPMWPLVRAERSALTELNIPHFVSPTDSDQIADASGMLTSNGTQSGLNRARDRFDRFDREEIAWQVEVIRLSTGAMTHSENGNGELGRKPIACPDMSPQSGPDRAVFVRGAADISRYLCGLAIRSGPGAAWVGLDWLGDSDICRPAPLGDDLYNGAPGICLFLAAQAKLTGNEEAAHLAVAGMSTLRHNLRGLNAARVARGLGTGGANGMGSVVYTLTVLSELLGSEEFLADAQRAASLLTHDVITADRSLDVMDGSAGGVLGLLKLYRATKNRDFLDRATQCGEHLLSQPRSGTEGRRSWVGVGVGPRPLNGMSHGAAGFAYALSSLSAAIGSDDFVRAARECVAFENASFSSSHSNWPDFRSRRGEIGPAWLCQWCHGAAGIGLARIGTLRCRTFEENDLQTDILRAVCCVRQSWPYEGDTLCCGNLGNIELLSEAALALNRPELREEASRRFMAVMTAADVRGEYFFDGIDKRFSLGLFRGVAGVGYTLSRQLDPHLPNVLIWE